MNRLEVMHAITAVCVQRRKFTLLDKLTETANGFEARIYTRLSDPRNLSRALDKAGLDVRQIRDQGGEWFVFTLVVR